MISFIIWIIMSIVTACFCYCAGDDIPEVKGFFGILFLVVFFLGGAILFFYYLT